MPWKPTILVLVAALLGAVEPTTLWPADGSVWTSEGPVAEGTLSAGTTAVAMQLAREKPWDLSAHGEVRITLRNAGEVVVRGWVRIASDTIIGHGGQGGGAWGAPIRDEPYQRFAQRRIDLEPGAESTLTIPLRRVPFASPIPPLTGIRTCPPELRNRVDPAQVLECSVRLEAGADGRRLSVLSVVAAGEPEMAVANPTSFLPCIDRFGQYRHRTWPGKITNAADLAGRVAQEDADLAAHPAPAQWNAWGGWADGPQLQATGTFRTARVDGRWWLVDPDGRLFWSQGVCSVGIEKNVRLDGTLGVPHTIIDGREAWFEDRPFDDPANAGFVGSILKVHSGIFAGKTARTYNFPGANLARKHGANWEDVFAERLPVRLRSWGFNTLGNWTQPRYTALSRLPYTLGINTAKAAPIAAATGHWGRFPDPWGDLATVAQDALAQQSDARTDPWCIGYFIGNELSWGEPDTLALATLASPPQQPAKRRFLARLQERHASIDALNATWGTTYGSWEALAASTTPPDRQRAQADLLDFNAAICDAYYAEVAKVIRAQAPGRLILGSRLVLGWGTAQALAACQRHCDLVSFNVYAPDWDKVKLPDLDAPILISEYGTGASDRGLSSSHLFGVATQDARAAWIARWQAGAAADRRIVGMHWFQFRDESVGGRAHDGEDFNCGLVDVADTPYAETIAAFRSIVLYPRTP
jgi:hypothetical protein